MKPSDISRWEPAFITPKSIGSNSCNESRHFAAIVTNQPIEDQAKFLDILARATLIVFADGGANHVKDLKLAESEEHVLLPDFICGDLDSIRPDVKAYYEHRGAKIIQDPDQYSSDLTKSLRCVKDYADSLICEWSAKEPLNSPKPELDAVIMGGIGGRFDQGFSQLHHLYTASENAALPNGRVFLMNLGSICFLLYQGVNKISTPVGPGLFAENLGIIPIGRPSVISTKGLEWNVNDWHTEFGGLISTSNHIKSDSVEVETSERVLLTIELDWSNSK